MVSWFDGIAAFITQSAALLIFLAGVAHGIGTQGVTLFVNRISPLRFGLNLLAAGLLYLLSALLWIASTWLIANTVFGITQSLLATISVVSFGYVPLLLSALVLIPYLGPLIGRLLNLLSFVLVNSALAGVFGISWWQALLCCTLGWLGVQALNRLIARPTETLDRWLWQLTTGKHTRLGPNDIPRVLIDYIDWSDTSHTGQP